MDTYKDLNMYMSTINRMHYICIYKCKEWMDRKGFYYMDMSIGGIALITYMLLT